MVSGAMVCECFDKLNHTTRFLAVIVTIIITTYISLSQKRAIESYNTEHHSIKKLNRAPHSAAVAHI